MGGVYCLMCCNGVGGGFGVVLIVICLTSECGFIYLFIHLFIYEYLYRIKMSVIFTNICTIKLLFSVVLY